MDRNQYAGLGNARVFNVERAFMKHTFQVSFSNHLGVKRKYCYSVTDPAVHAKWISVLHRQILLARHSKPAMSHSTNTGQAIDRQQRIRIAAEAVALTVLRDALIPPTEDREKTSRDHDNEMEKEKENSNPARPRVERSGSVSIAYGALAGQSENDLGPLQAGKLGNPTERTGGMLECQTGKELVLVCRQNSLLPGMLELLQAGVEQGRAGVKS
jgi:hypothetical protein